MIIGKIGLAFPAPAGVSHITEQGMTLRDYFAAKAMEGFISATAWHPDFIYPDNFNFVAGGRAADAVAESAYKYADAMLKARQA